MGRLPASAAISLAVHALLGACVVVRAVACEQAGPPAAPVAQPAPAPDDAPLEVELFTVPADDEAGPAWPASPAAVAAIAHATPAQRIATAPAVPTAPIAPGGTLLAMRDGPDLRIHEIGEPPPHDRLAPPGPAVTGVDAEPTAPVAPRAEPKSPDSGALDPGETHEAFSLEVDPDGTAHIHDGGNLRFFPDPPHKRDVQSRIARWREQLDTDSNGQPDLCENPTREDAPRPIQNPIGDVGVTIAKFDINDWLLRRHGVDPYASAKLHQLDATRDGRAEIGARHAHTALAHAGELVQAQMDTLWSTVADPAERKRELFALWDECSETGSEDVVEGTYHARARIAKFIRARLPAAQPGAYTAAELAALNQRKHSTEVFAPYESAD